MIKKEQIDRINFLAKKSKNDGLSTDEKIEQEQLRTLYINSMKESLISQLDNTYILDANANKVKLKRKNK